jgi:3-phenylpropionate/trans-cinnamate dioxygenase ferredoxin reductase component
MEDVKYLIVGGGLAADAAARGIREIDRVGSILIVSDETDPPYDRPLLSKALWTGTPLHAIWRHTELAGATLRLGTRIITLDPSRRVATDADANVYAYEKLLLATGGSPRQLCGSDQSVIYFRKLGDFRKAWSLATLGADFAVVGGGFIGSEIAAALARNKKKVSMIFPNASIGENIYPRPLANFLNVYFRKHGVSVRFNERVVRIERRDNRLIVHTDRNDDFSVDAVIAGLGIEPNVGLAKIAGLKVSDGIIVNERLCTSDPHIFAAGDVANFPCASLDRRLRCEHEDNARAMGRIAGRNMAGDSESYRHLPFFYSDLFDLGYEAVGEIDSELEVVEDWERIFRKGVIYYLKRKRVRGILLWNTPGFVEAARALIKSKRTLDANALIGRSAWGKHELIARQPGAALRSRQRL